MGLGLDLPNIKVVFYVDRPYTIYDYAQESGRAGRNIPTSEAILFIPKLLRERNIRQNERRDLQIIDKYIENPNRLYRRSILSEYLDESPRGYGDSDLLCDVCTENFSGRFFTSKLTILSYRANFSRSKTSPINEIDRVVPKISSLLISNIPEGDNSIGMFFY